MKTSSSNRLACVAVAFASLLVPAVSVRATDALVDGAVSALARLTDPRRLATLSDPLFRAQLGPALGWLHVARRQDVAPEAVIGRAFALNGLDNARARLTREALLRNLARADAWELFTHDESARALAGGQPAPIAAGLHRGHLAEAAILPPALAGGNGTRDFASLVLRADDEAPVATPGTAAPRPPTRRHPRRLGDLLAVAPPSPAARRAASGTVSPPAVAEANASPSVVYDDALPIAYNTLTADSGAINVRVLVSPGQAVDLAAYGGPNLGFRYSNVERGSLRFVVVEDDAPSGDAPLQSADLSHATFPRSLYERPAPAGRLRISAAAPPAVDGTLTVLFEFPAREPAAAR